MLGRVRIEDPGGLGCRDGRTIVPQGDSGDPLEFADIDSDVIITMEECIGDRIAEHLMDPDPVGSRMSIFSSYHHRGRSEKDATTASTDRQKSSVASRIESSLMSATETTRKSLTISDSSML